MGRKPNVPHESWVVVKDNYTGGYLAFMKFERVDIVKDIGTRYEQVAEFQSKEDADRFCEIKSLPLSIDALAFLRYEHLVKQSPEVADVAISQMPLMPDEASFPAMVEAVRKDTGRQCFGDCHSLEGAPACYICYTERPSTWGLCALTKCLNKKGEN